MSDQYELLRPLITPRIQELVSARLFNGLRFFADDAKTLLPEYTRGEAKLVLLLAKVANPREYMTQAETHLIEGGQRKCSSETVQCSSDKVQKTVGRKKRRK